MTALRDLNQQEVRLPQGVIRYRELGTGEPIVLVHGLLVNGLRRAGFRKGWLGQGWWRSSTP